jgi:hypothetical protein
MSHSENYLFSHHYFKEGKREEMDHTPASPVHGSFCHNHFLLQAQQATWISNQVHSSWSQVQNTAFDSHQ